MSGVSKNITWLRYLLLNAILELNLKTLIFIGIKQFLRFFCFNVSNLLFKFVQVFQIYPV